MATREGGMKRTITALVKRGKIIMPPDVPAGEHDEWIAFRSRYTDISVYWPDEFGRAVKSQDYKKAQLQLIAHPSTLSVYILITASKEATIVPSDVVILSGDELIYSPRFVEDRMHTRKIRRFLKQNPAWGE